MRRASLLKPSLEASTLDWMLQAAFGKSGGGNGEPGAFPPPPRFGVDESGTWSSMVRSPVDSPSSGALDYGVQMGGEPGWDARTFEGMSIGQPEFGTAPQEKVWPW